MSGHLPKLHNILKFADQYIYNTFILSNLLWDFDHWKLFTSLNQWFTRIDHSYNYSQCKKNGNLNLLLTLQINKTSTGLTNERKKTHHLSIFIRFWFRN